MSRPRRPEEWESNAHEVPGTRPTAGSLLVLFGRWLMAVLVIALAMIGVFVLTQVAIPGVVEWWFRR